MIILGFFGIPILFIIIAGVAVLLGFLFSGGEGEYGDGCIGVFVRLIMIILFIGVIALALYLAGII